MKPLSICQLGLISLCLLGILGLTQAEELTPEEKQKILDGIKAADDFTLVLQYGTFTEALKSLTETIVPWVDAIELFGKFLGIFGQDDNELLDEMKKGFEEVNKRLDDIKEGIAEVKEAIDWLVVSVKFQEIETNIRLMDEKLKEVHMAPEPAHGMAEYIRVYDSQYDEAGLKLYDSIVHNDQIFSENILTAGMKYTDYYRKKNQEYMRGLISLMMKSSNIEISYQEFMEHDRGMADIWEKRLEECHDAMEAADKILEGKWQDLFRNEVNDFAKNMKGASHTQFRDATYAFLTEKYDWRHWFVLSYDTCRGWDMHSIYSYATYVYIQFSYYERNFVIATSDDSLHYDTNLAESYLVDRKCTSSWGDCHDNAALRLTDIAPFHGVMQAAISRRCGWAFIARTGRVNYDIDINLTHDRGFVDKFTLFYFG